MHSRTTAIAIAALLLGACDAPTAPTSRAVSTPAQSLGQTARANDENCSFSKGTTTCTTTVQYQETSTHSEYSGCFYGPNAIPGGSRVRTFSDTYLVTVTTTTMRRGKSDHVYSSETTTTRTRMTSTMLSDVCNAP
jgi:hypothetical protein